MCYCGNTQNVPLGTAADALVKRNVHAEQCLEVKTDVLKVSVYTEVKLQ